MKKDKLGIILFDEYETLDVFGPVEIFGCLSNLYKVNFYSINGGLIKNRHGVEIMTLPLNTSKIDIFLIPGGLGTRKEIDNKDLIDAILITSKQSKFVLTVCTGSALLAKTGLLNNLKATSNKRAFDWVVKSSLRVIWDESARWTVSEKFYTSSGVSAGIDMSLGFIADQHGTELAKKIAYEIEYRWIDKKDDDSFKATN